MIGTCMLLLTLATIGPLKPILVYIARDRIITLRRVVGTSEHPTATSIITVEGERSRYILETPEAVMSAPCVNHS